MKLIKQYCRIWLMLAHLSFASMFNNTASAVLFLVGKIIRFLFFLGFIFALTQKTQKLGTYNSQQIVFFFLIFNLIDITSQFLFRGIYHFRSILVSGQFDLILVKPINPLFRILLGYSDILDFITLAPLIWYIIYFTSKNSSFLPVSNPILFLILLINGLFIALSIHILISALGVTTLEIDNTVWLWRDLSSLAKIPIDLYTPTLRSFITLIIPIGLAITVPAKALFGLISLPNVLAILIFSALLFSFSLKTWQLALRHYSSTGN